MLIPIKTNNMEQDLFETPELLPTEVQIILHQFSNMDNTYDNCVALVNELNLVGYGCNYGLDGIPYDLQQL
jgi:hypothetical protein